MSDHFSMSKAKTAQDERAACVVLAKDPNRAMQEMMTIIDELHGILDAETRALTTADTKTFFGLQEKKIRAAQAYHDGATQILERKDDFAGIKVSLRKKLEERQEAFQKTTTLNLKKLKSMNRGVQRYSNRLMESAREHAAKVNTVNYSAAGKVTTNPNKTVSIGVSESA
ncbi:MAG: hypothetical protein EOM26_11065 [Alphaproteobacteria bacterium]|nr:hypothetical protein [Alphaproteobacteria bacterium]